MDYRVMGAFSDNLEKLFSVSMTSKTSPFKSLSGGNQQKVIVGTRVFALQPVCGAGPAHAWAGRRLHRIRARTGAAHAL